MIKLAPSALSKQPWKIIEDGDSYHIYILKSYGYNVEANFEWIVTIYIF